MIVLLMMLIAAVVAKETEYWTSEDKPLQDHRGKEAMIQQANTEGRLRSDGNSGLKQVSNV